MRLFPAAWPNAGPAPLPYGRHAIDESDIAAVADVLRGDWLTTGPSVAAFEAAFAQTVDAPFAVACANGTAALHLAMLGLDLGPGDAVIVPTLTFLATANAARYVGAEVVFADVDPETGLMTPATLDAALASCEGRRIGAVACVHYAGGQAETEALAARAGQAGAPLVEDACHALGTHGPSGRVGDARHAAMATFSFHPVKTIATGEGGMVTTRDEALAQRLRRLRSHGMERDSARFEAPDLACDADGGPAPWAYEMVEPGFNYRLSDIQCALGLSQLKKLDGFLARRRRLQAIYAAALAPLAPHVRALAAGPGVTAGWHLMGVLIDFKSLGQSRRAVMAALAAQGVHTQVHYIPVHRQAYYRARYGQQDLPGADRFYARTLSLPLFPGMRDEDPLRVVEALRVALDLSA